MPLAVARVTLDGISADPSFPIVTSIALDASRQRSNARKTLEGSDFPDQQYDLIAFFDCLHDMGDPVGACKRAAEVLAPEGSAMIVEPMAGNTVEENFNIIGRTFSGASTLCCTANSMALGGPALGAVAPESAIREAVLAGGFTEFHRVTETPFNRIFEARH